ncbi:M61 family metallopeptidase [Thiomicrorhabdus sp. 6S2-11]|uniref:M61 family metallopeptidase n=1 Tax=Thiomicrorhabdus marina TaxID=2818442 RepID=A0ABS3Q758_9GAMM|nr:PDZ domain-containing protein [Thiomicrorhabdus marina]MBO1927963.1 M61 family metallopeptidase [Thiomicrorhabdus marina]
MSQFSSPELQQISQKYINESTLPELAKPVTKDEACARHYSISPANAQAHLFDVQLRIAFPTKQQLVSLPNWIPGSYLIRDFSKHLSKLEAFTDDQQPLKVQLIDKSTWEIEATENNDGNIAAINVRYQVYAWDLSVRGAHFDESHAFFNGTSVFVEVIGQRELPCVMSLKKSPVCFKNAWKAATGMEPIKIDHHGFGHYKADNYLALIDHPVEIGNYTEIEFRACGVPHKMVLTGIFECDLERLKNDLIKICEYEIKLFGEPAPMDSYLFQVMVTGSDYGGLEHRNSTALICSRNDLPYHGMDKPSDGYLQFLELCSHEYFHTWNVKRIMPKAYQNPDLSAPIYSRQLWWFEGITSYYDALILLRCGLIDQDTYLKLLAQQLTRVYRMPGRFKQSVSESSFYAWTKFYQQDENAPNAIISYYTKGSLVALALDLTIREQSQGQQSLDNILLYLWENYGKVNQGLEEFEIEQLCSQITGIDLQEFFAQTLDSTDDVDLTSLFAKFGYEFSFRANNSLADMGGSNSGDLLAVNFGANVIDTATGGVQLKHIWQEASAQLAGLAANDEIIALNGLRISNKSQLETLLRRCQPGNSLKCDYFRRDELRHCVLTLTPAIPDRVEINKQDKCENRLNWLTDNTLSADTEL